MDELNPPEAEEVMVTDPDEFLVTFREVGDAESEKVAVLEVTVSETVVVLVTPLPVPVMVTV